MINKGAHPVLGVRVHAVDYAYATHRILQAADAARPLAVSALAVHGVMTGYRDETHRRRLNGLDLVVPDGQPVRWALRWLHGVRLDDRVYGPTLTLHVLRAAARRAVPVFFYGSTAGTLRRLRASLARRLPDLVIAGSEPSKFRRVTAAEKQEVVRRIRASGARMVFVGLGCPRQEAWAYEYRNALAMPLLAVGAAFDFHAGTLPQAPPWMQRQGLEWLYRLAQEPRRLWRRYLLLNPAYLAGVAREAMGRTAPPLAPTGREPEERHG
jgi:exopolysaccharide biosynthesis WecB/TagA/CpsF family protein